MFISKKLGKHLACKPSEMDNLGKLMATIYNEKNKEESNGTVIAFAETGTAVGHSFLITYVEIMNLFILLESSLTS